MPESSLYKHGVKSQSRSLISTERTKGSNTHSSGHNAISITHVERKTTSRSVIPLERAQRRSLTSKDKQRFNRSQHNVDYLLRSTRLRIEHSCFWEEHNVDPSLEMETQRVDHAFVWIGRNVDHSLRRKTQWVNHSILWKECNVAPALRRTRQSVDHVFSLNEHNIDHSL